MTRLPHYLNNKETYNQACWVVRYFKGDTRKINNYWLENYGTAKFHMVVYALKTYRTK